MFSASNDVWVLTNANGACDTPQWIQLQPEGQAPSTRLGHTAVYDREHNRMIVFGGAGVSSFQNDVWILTHANGLDGTPRWLALDPAGELPVPRVNPAAAFDLDANTMIVFGGQSHTSPPRLNDVWKLTHANGLGHGRNRKHHPTWMQLSPTGDLPRPRDQMASVFDEENHRLIIFGGQGVMGFGFLGDLWVLSLDEDEQ